MKKERLKREEKEKGVEKRVQKSEENVEAACDRTVCVCVRQHTPYGVCVCVTHTEIRDTGVLSDYISDYAHYIVGERCKEHSKHSKRGSHLVDSNFLEGVLQNLEI